jgi:ribonuclease HII
MQASERRRLLKMSAVEQHLRKKGYRLIAGVDEVGRGPLAGPVVACACILPENFLLEDVNDSKKLSAEVREKIYQDLKSNPEVIYSVGIVDSDEIDKINILQATFKAMTDAIKSLKNKPEYILFDGNQIPAINIPTLGIVKGDSISISIAAASIIAKQTRDDIMIKYHKKWPCFGFDLHKGYATVRHREAVKEYGPCEIHRKSFDPISSFLEKKKEKML